MNGIVIIVNLIEIPWRDPEAMLECVGSVPWAALLDSGGSAGDVRARWSYLCLSPTDTLSVTSQTCIRNGKNVGGDCWQHLKEMTNGHAPCDSVTTRADWHPPFTGGVVGVASYALGLSCEGICSRHASTTPLLMAARYTDVLAFDRLNQRCWWTGASHNIPQIPDVSTRKVMPVRAEFRPDCSRPDWIGRVGRVIRYIEAGDIFQANLTMRWHADQPSDFDEVTAYRQLRAVAPAPFGAWFRTPDFSLLSASVERFVALGPEGAIETRPIKGTAPVGETTEAEARNRATLASDEKELAENLMITDLMRSDIGRVSRLGSVRVPQLSTVERFEHVLHLVSAVEGRLGAGLDAIDLLRATLPAGSVTGAPKKRALEIIDELEISARGSYCGNLFWIDDDGCMDSSVIIRSLERVGSHGLSIGAGGGITFLSDPASEYEEMLLKVRPILQAFGA